MQNTLTASHVVNLLSRSPGSAMQHESHITNEPENKLNPESKHNETL